MFEYSKILNYFFPKPVKHGVRYRYKFKHGWGDWNEGPPNLSKWDDGKIHMSFKLVQSIFRDWVLDVEWERY